jgi:LysM repeat protein
MLLSSVVALIFSSAVTSVFAQNQQCTRTYTVQTGDICDGISAAQHASTYQLAVLNPGINAQCSNLMPGQVLCLGTPGADCNDTYVVEPNDTCESVAAAHNADLGVLYHNNPQLNGKCDNLYIGEVVCVANSDIAPPLPSGAIPATSIPTTAYPATTDLPWCN